MEYSAPPFFKRGPSLLTRFAFFAVLSAALLVSDARFDYLTTVRNVTAIVLYPLQRLAALPAEALGRIGRFFVTQAELQRENQQLRHQTLMDAAALQTQRALASENEQLRELLALEARIARTLIAAEILHAPRDPFARRVLINRGIDNGVQAGYAVVDRTGVVGQVTRVYPWASEVTLITDKEHAVPIQVLRSGLRGVTFGIGYDGTLELRFMPVNADIQNGDVLVTSGIDGTYPPGLPVAVVSSIERNTAYAFARITCTPAAGVSSYGQVVVVSRDPMPQPGAPESADLEPRNARAKKDATP
jgi:rod shape-determining protein MreC